MRRQVSGHGRARRQHDGNAATALRTIADDELTTMCTRDGLRDCEAEAAAFGIDRSRPGEPFQDKRPLLRWDSGAAVIN